MWLNENNLCPEWLRSITGIDAFTCTVSDPNVKGGYSGASLIKLVATLYEGKTLNLVLKTALGESQSASKMYGTVREGKVYEILKNPNFKLTELSIPEALFAYANLETGMKVIILPDLSDSVPCKSIFEIDSKLDIRDP